MDCRIAIVGGSGFIGSALADYLSTSLTIKVIDRKPLPESLRNRVEYDTCDVRERNELARALDDVDFVVHTAVVQIPLINEKKRLGYEVNLLGTQNICRLVDEIPSIKGMILAGTWHVFGERDLKGSIDEKFGFRPDNVEERARLYALSKVGQEVIVRYYDEMSDKIFGVIRMGTVLGESMPKKTAANIFISKGLKGEPITPYKHSMHRPMLYIDVNDVCSVFKTYIFRILSGKIHKQTNSLDHVINLYWREPMTIIELSNLVRDSIMKLSRGRIDPEIQLIDLGKPILYTAEDKRDILIDQRKTIQLIGAKKLTNPRTSIERIIRNRIAQKGSD